MRLKAAETLFGVDPATPGAVPALLGALEELTADRAPATAAAGGQPRYRAARVGGCLQATVEQRPGGIQVLRSTEPLGAYPRRLTDRLEHWAAVAPERTVQARTSFGPAVKKVSRPSSR